MTNMVNNELALLTYDPASRPDLVGLIVSLECDISSADIMFTSN